MSDVLSARFPLSTVREFRKVAQQRGQSLSDMLRDALEYELTYKAKPGELTQGGQSIDLTPAVTA